MSLHHGLRPVLTALLSGVLLSVTLPDTSWAGQDLRYLAFHPVPLNPAARADAIDTARVEFSLQSTRANPAARASQYLDSIAAARRAGGDLALPLGEQLLGFGRALHEQGKYDEALAAFAESRHVMRVNLGLNSVEQVPVLKAMFAAYAAQGDVDSAHATQEALFNLRLRHYGGDSANAVNALLEWADWNVNLYLLLDPQPSMDSSLRSFNRLNDPRLQLAYDLYTQALQTLQQRNQADDERLVTTERKLAALNFITNRKLQATYGEALQRVAAASDGDDSASALEDASTANFEDGSSALRRALEHSERRPQRRNDDIAARMVELGDWYLLFDHRAAAMEMYRDALAFMREASLPQEEVERIMSPGMPVPTPDTAYREPVDASKVAGYIDVEFELTQYGMATKPKIIASSQNNRQIERELLREIRDCKFRPKFVADAPVKREKIQLRYYYTL